MFTQDGGNCKGDVGGSSGWSMRPTASRGVSPGKGRETKYIGGSGGLPSPREGFGFAYQPAEVWGKFIVLWSLDVVGSFVLFTVWLPSFLFLRLSLFLPFSLSLSLFRPFSHPLTPILLNPL